MRQFHQIGVELFGVAEPAGDIEVIAHGAPTCWTRWACSTMTTLELNTLGDTASRDAYRDGAGRLPRATTATG